MKRILLINMILCFALMVNAQPLLAPKGIKVDKGINAVTLTNAEMKTISGNTRNISTGYLAAEDTINPFDAGLIYTPDQVDSVALAKGDSIKATISSADVFVIQIENDAFSPADATTYYSGFPSFAVPDANAGYHKIAIAIDCKLVGYSSSIRSVSSSQESFSIYIRKNNASDYLLENNFVSSASTGLPVINHINTLDNNYAAGDYIELKIITPTWATNPTTMYTRFDLYFQKL